MNKWREPRQNITNVQCRYMYMNIKYSYVRVSKMRINISLSQMAVNEDEIWF